MRLMLPLLIALLLASCITTAMAQEPKKLPVPAPVVNPLISRIAFGSCSNQDDPMPILRTVLEWEPDLFVYLGDNGWESWTNFPMELMKMVNLITETKANGVVFISGDVHWGELSILKTPDCYPLHDLTASGLNRDWSNVEPNQNRDGEACMDFHFGMLDIDWAGDPSVELRIHDMTGRGRVRKSVRLNELQF